MWQKVCKSADLGIGQSYVYEDPNGDIGLFRLPEGVFAIDNICPHQEADLNYGELEGCKIVCPMHMWRFNIKTGVSDVSSDYNLMTFPTKEEDDWIWVDPDAGETEGEPDHRI